MLEFILGPKFENYRFHSQLPDVSLTFNDRDNTKEERRVVNEKRIPLLMLGHLLHAFRRIRSVIVESTDPTQQELKLQQVITLAEHMGTVLWQTPFNRQSSEVRELAKGIHDLITEIRFLPENKPHQRYANPQYLQSVKDFLLTRTRYSIDDKDDLGSIYQDSRGDKHPFLRGISIQELRQLSETKEVILFASMSGGILDAALIAKYLRNFCNLSVTIDVVAFTKHSQQWVTTLTRGKSAKEKVVIPLDDRILGRGYSMGLTKKAAAVKYGETNLLMSRRAQLADVDTLVPISD